MYVCVFVYLCVRGGLCSFSILSVGLFAFPLWDRTRPLGMSPTGFLAWTSDLNHPEVMIYCFYYNTHRHMYTHTHTHTHTHTALPGHIHNMCIFRCCINTDIWVSSYEKKNTHTHTHTDTQTLCALKLWLGGMCCVISHRSLSSPAPEQKQSLLI